MFCQRLFFSFLSINLRNCILLMCSISKNYLKTLFMLFYYQTVKIKHFTRNFNNEKKTGSYFFVAASFVSFGSLLWRWDGIFFKRNSTSFLNFSEQLNCWAISCKRSMPFFIFCIWSNSALIWSWSEREIILKTLDFATNDSNLV